MTKKCSNGEYEFENNALCVSAQKYIRVPEFTGQSSNSTSSRGEREEEGEEKKKHKRAMRVGLVHSFIATVYGPMSMLDGNTGTSGPRVSIYAVQHCRNARQVLIPVSEGGTRG